MLMLLAKLTKCSPEVRLSCRPSHDLSNFHYVLNIVSVGYSPFKDLISIFTVRQLLILFGIFSFVLASYCHGLTVSSPLLTVAFKRTFSALSWVKVLALNLFHKACQACLILLMQRSLHIGRCGPNTWEPRDQLIPRDQGCWGALKSNNFELKLLDFVILHS